MAARTATGATANLEVILAAWVVEMRSEQFLPSQKSLGQVGQNHCSNGNSKDNKPDSDDSIDAAIRCCASKEQ